MANNLNPTLSHVLAKHTGKIVRNFGVATPGIVTAAHNESGVTTAIDVQPAVHRLLPTAVDEDVDVYEEHAVLRHVPVIWPVGRGFKMKGQLQPGDTVMLVCQDRGMSNWRATGDASLPDDARVHDWSSAAAIPGLVPDSSPYPEPTDAAALASKIDAMGQAIAAIPEAIDLATAMTAINGVLTAFAAFSVPTYTVGSTVLKLEE